MTAAAGWLLWLMVLALIAIMMVAESKTTTMDEELRRYDLRRRLMKRMGKGRRA